MAARKRPTERPVGDDRRPSQSIEKTDRPGYRKVTMWLPVDLAKKLHHAAIEDECEIGQVAAPALSLALAPRYWVERSVRSAKPLAPAGATESIDPVAGPAELGIAG